LALLGTPFARHLDVCIDADPDRIGNCSACWKCMRTMLTLDIAGRLDDVVPEVFRREPYERRLPAFHAELLASTEPNEIEVVEFGDRNGWRWGALPRVHALRRRVQRRLGVAARAARNRVRARAVGEGSGSAGGQDGMRRRVPSTS